MSQSDLDRWNSRFRSAGYVYGEAPNAFLAEQAATLAPGRALCVADGEGRNGVWLATRGWDVVSLDFSPVAQDKARALAARHGVAVNTVLADVHDWAYPAQTFDLVADIFSQFSAPEERQKKWRGMVKALRPGGTLIVQGYTPEQLRFGTGGPSQVENLYTEAMLRAAFNGFDILHLEQGVHDMNEGPGHSGRSAVIGLVARARS